MDSLKQVYSSLSFTSKTLGTAMVGFSMVCALVPGALTVFGLVPGKTLPYVWQIVTSGFVHDSIISLAANLFASLFLLKTLEPLMMRQALLESLCVAVVFSGILTFILMYVLYLILISTGFFVDQAVSLLYNPVCGFYGGIGGLLVMMKQKMPENEVTLFSRMHFHARDLPGMYILFIILIDILSGAKIGRVLLAIFGSYAVWLHLRFFHRDPDSLLTGDPRDDFRFASFFPVAVQPSVDAFARRCSRLVGIDKVGRDSQAGQEAPNDSNQKVSSKDDPDASRRREKGAKSVEERLGERAQQKKERSDDIV